MSARRLRARRPIEDIDLADLSDRANDCLKDDAVDGSTVDIRYDRDRNRFIAASRKPIEVCFRVRVGDP